jgi:uncharacterized membrane protein YgcG
VQRGTGSVLPMTFSVFVKVTLVVFAFAALLAAFEDDGFVPSLLKYSTPLMLGILVEAYVAPRIRRRLRVRASRAHSSSSSYSYGSDGSSGGGSDCGWSDSGGGGDSGGGDSC